MYIYIYVCIYIYISDMSPQIRVSMNMQDGSIEVALVALRDIAASEVLSFDYVTTEWDMDR